MTRATLNVIPLNLSKNHFASVPAAKYVPRAGTVADLEAQIVHEQEVHKTRAFIAAKRLQAAKTLNKVLIGSLIGSALIMIASISVAVI